MLLLTVTPLMLASIVDPVRLVGINADGFMLLLIMVPPTLTSIVIPLGPTGIGIDPPVFTHADFVCNAGGRIPGACDVRPLVTDPG
jgi:hypothetical protein